MIDLLKNRVLILGLSLVVLGGCSATDTQPDEPADDQTMTEESTSETQSDSEAYSAEDGDGVSSEDMSAEERADQMRQEAEQKAMQAANTIYFDFDSADVRRESRSILEAHAAYLAADDSASVVLEGHTDERGSGEYNMALGERRAQSVARFLKVNDVSEDQIETVSYGEEKPAVDESNEDAWAQNRRVEINYE
ncbi:peptidoglycan-associated lipoprotein [Halospina denitrificans]|uniref:Peptidoglycan-associated lipoprotein n=1 Tax=Halospina denitrificans TaxID=332522 RepID=A0A4R7JYE2_9GAMM|nr:peptidoglycan-associated lipoprotein Pal [Halospina denitrificans]TDT42964.1 peptidoglycan-associated lipoprotein [Halospina denitrificans]